jgi:hypothetical protein
MRIGISYRTPATAGQQEEASRKYNLTFVAIALNLFNVVNLGAPNGVLDSHLFDQMQPLASGPFGNPTLGKRAILLQAYFSFERTVLR